MGRSLWWAGLLAGLGVLLALGSGPLALPAPWQFAAFASRIRMDGAAVAAIAVLRSGMVGVGVYLGGLGVLAELSRHRRLGAGCRVVLRLPLPGRAAVLRRLGVPVLLAGMTLVPAAVASAEPPAGGATGRSLAAPTVVWLGPSADDGPSGDAPVLRWLPELPPPAPAPASTTPSTMSPSSAAPPASTSPAPRRVAPLTPPTTAAPAASRHHGGPIEVPPGRSPVGAPTSSVPAPGLATPGDSGPPVATIPSTYTLVPGDHLWKVAQRTLTAALGHPPAEEELAQYWWRLVERNRSALPDPADPDFVLPGMTVSLPPLTP